MVDKLLSALLVIVVGVALIPVMSGSVGDLTNVSHPDYVDGAAGTLVGILPLLFVVAIVVGVVKYIRAKNGD